MAATRRDVRRPARSAGLRLTLLTALLTGCGGGPDIDAARKFDKFPLYWVGPKFERWELTEIDGLDYPSPIVSFMYGDCTPHDGEQPSCTPPFQIQVSRPCWAVGKSQGKVRGAPVGTIDSAPVLFTRGAQIKVYRGEGSYPGLPLKVLRALRSVNDVPPIVSSTGRFRPPARCDG